MFILGGLVEKAAYCKHLLMPPDLSEHSGSNIPQTGKFMNNRNLFFIVLEAGKSKIRMPWSGSNESPLPGCRWLTSHCILA